ncbi:hypothetical protein IFM61606_04259 [Aspergillus udagawae]|uniref:Zn(2)-C6 fungal-type domain-containing protein n=2 Tax=Aspergillus udagawae TaxID=91492 RepID=A0A8H3RKY2_9EURO|nr:hypothetical protein IFM46972_00498 [Aspergillus udagawae]GFG24352.1 hypothetical protein IFM61606_04259 [Aspergillus udagawae]
MIGMRDIEPTGVVGVVAVTADNACVSCAQKKRRCDRAIPVCSTCRRLRRECSYAGPQFVLAQGASVFPLEAHRRLQDEIFHLSLQRMKQIDATRDRLPPVADEQQANRACLACKAGKRRCDRRLPSCTRCTRRQTECTYWNGSVTTIAHSPSTSYFVDSLGLQRVDAKVSFPVPTQKHMPILLHSFIETFGMAPLEVENGSLAFILRTGWVSQALADPCFFHATLFAASAHLDAFQRKSDNPITIYHYTMALRLLREKLASPGGALDEGTIACIPPLVFFSSMRSDKDSSRIHREGLMKLLRVKGGLHKMGFGGFFTALIPVCVLTEAVIFDSEFDIPGLDIPPTPLAPPTNLVTAALKRAAHQTGYYNLSPEAITIFQDISLICRYLDGYYVASTGEESLYNSTKIKWRNQLQQKISQRHDAPENDHPSTSNGIDQSCQAAALIFWYLLDDYFSVNASTLQNLVQTLKDSLVKTSMDTWIRCSPEAHTWICLVGVVASSPCSDDRAWFSLRHGQPVVCIRSEGASLYLDCWRTYDWLNRRRKLRLKH